MSPGNTNQTGRNPDGKSKGLQNIPGQQSVKLFFPTMSAWGTQASQKNGINRDHLAIPGPSSSQDSIM